MKSRIHAVRAQADLTMAEFAKRIGMTTSSISLFESGKATPSDRTVLSICREFGVSEHWLRTGEGEMFEQTLETVLDKLCAEYDLGAEHRAIVEGFLDLTPQDRDVVLKYFHNVFSRSASPAAQSAAVPDSEAQRIAESDEYKSLVEKNKPAEDEPFTTVG